MIALARGARFALVILLWIMSSAQRASAQAPGALAGTITERGTKRPLPDVTVTLSSTSTTVSTRTDDRGAFAFADLSPGEYTVSLSRADLETVSAPEAVLSGARRTVEYAVSLRSARARPFEATVRSLRKRSDAVEMILHADEARGVAGTQGDAAKVVQNLAGAARAPVGSGQLVLWGARPADTRVYVDDVEVPALYHLGGLRSVVNGDLISSISMSPGGYGAAFGRGLGGLVRIDTRDYTETGVHGYVGVDVLDASALITAKLSQRVRLTLSGRYSYLDQIVKGLAPADTGDLFPVPRYHDYQAKLAVDLGRGAKLSVLFLGAGDTLSRATPSLDPASRRAEDINTASYRGIIRYSRTTHGDGAIEVTPFFGFDRERRRTQFGLAPTAIDVDEWRYGARAQLRSRVHRRVLLWVGLDLLGRVSSAARSGALTVPAREGDVYIFGTPPSDALGFDRYRTHVVDAAPYLSTEISVGPVTFSPGLRLSASFIDGNQSVPRQLDAPVIGFRRFLFAPEPRLVVTVRAHDRVSLTAAAGLYHQAPSVNDLSAVFGNPSLGLERAVHATLGAAVRATETLGIEITGYYKELFDLVTRSTLPSPAIGAALVQEGRGRAYGGQVLVRQELWRGLSGWIAYSVGRSEREDHPGTATRLFDYDQTHTLTVVASYRWRGWSFGTRLRYSSGYPRTGVTGAFFDARSDQYQPLFGAQNAERLPDFVQWDLRVDRLIKWSRVALRLYLEVQNVTYQRNAEEVAYSGDYARRSFITGIPTLAVLGGRVEF